MKRFLFLSSSVAALAFPLTALAQEVPPLPAPAPEPANGGLHFEQAAAPAEAPPPATPQKPDAWRVSLGARVGYVTDGGFDTFADNDVLSQFSLEGTRTLVRANKLSLAAGLAYDIGGRSDGFRGADSKLTAHRFTVPIVARYDVTPWLEPFARVAPGMGLVLTRVDDPSTPSRLTDTSATFAADLSGGVSFLVGPHGKSAANVPHFWITPEAGWSFTTGADVHPDPGRDDKDVLGTDASSRLGSVALNGFFWRVSAAMTF